ncbi:hypothetical protein Tco_1298601 [Tanacetum coccineum]
MRVRLWIQQRHESPCASSKFQGMGFPIMGGESDGTDIKKKTKPDKTEHRIEKSARKRVQRKSDQMDMSCCVIIKQMEGTRVARPLVDLRSSFHLHCIVIERILTCAYYGSYSNVYVSLVYRMDQFLAALQSEASKSKPMIG